MKKIIFIVLLFLLTAGLYASDYENGYRQGYADAISGQGSKYVLNTKQQPVVVEKVTIKSPWTIRYYKTEDGIPTASAYMRNSRYGVGTYSNAIIKDQELLWYFVINENSASIVLLEDGELDRRVQGNDIKPLKYNIIVRDVQNSSETRFTAFNVDNRIQIEDSSNFKKILEDEKSIILKLVRQDNRRYEYNLGTFDCSDYNKIYRSAFGK